ncbi:MAG: 4-phosphoerythronate dehydrogenase [Muribaculaceae bacterium]|nr:4-phosphoerythronate dehydrogenase [Muribaculaceae bacterium]
MKIVIENRIPFIQGILEPVAQVCYLPADGITPLAVADADALLVRTRTRCNAALLQGSRVRFIGSATIGTDHIDLDWCSTHGIAVANAPGCNAPAVAQWVFAAIALWMQRHHIAAPEGLTLGVIGVGHVGSIVAQWGRQLGFNVLLNDPPRGIGAQLPSPSVRGRGEGWDLQAHGCSLDQLLCGSDIVTVHTPLTSTGQWPTWHLLGEAQLRQMSRCRLLINAARGGIIDEAALLDWQGDLAIDCWEGEPHINSDLLQRAIVATPHIAGYSIEGKQRGTAMMIEALNNHYGWQLPVPHIAAPAQGAAAVTLSGILAGFDPRPLTARLQASPNQFESLRNTYPLRHEAEQ